MRDERRLRRTLSRHLISSNPAAEAAVSLLGGAAGREETFAPCKVIGNCVADGNDRSTPYSPFARRESL